MNPLTPSVSLLSATTTTLSSTLQSLTTSSIADLPRLSTVLSTTRHFELLPEPQLLAAQAALRDSIRPEVESLLRTVEGYLGKMERAEQGLIARGELLAGRLGEGDGTGMTSTRRLRGDADGGDGGRALSEKEEARYRLLKGKRERLELVVERLGLEVQQSERRLRKSMAAV